MPVLSSYFSIELRNHNSIIYVTISMPDGNAASFLSCSGNRCNTLPISCVLPSNAAKDIKKIKN